MYCWRERWVSRSARKCFQLADEANLGGNLNAQEFRRSTVWLAVVLAGLVGQVVPARAAAKCCRDSAAIPAAPSSLDWERVVDPNRVPYAAEASVAGIAHIRPANLANRLVRIRSRMASHRLPILCRQIHGRYGAARSRGDRNRWWRAAMPTQTRQLRASPLKFVALTSL